MRTLFGIQLTVLSVAVGWGWLRQLHWWNELRMDAGVLVAVAAGAGLAVGTRALFRVLSRWQGSHLDWFMRSFLHDIFAELPLRVLVALALLSGLAEEALFRGVMLNESGLVLSSLVFGLLHSGDRRLWAASVWSLGVGLALGVVYLLTGNLAHCVAVHASSNLVSFLLLVRD